MEKETKIADLNERINLRGMLESFLDIMIDRFRKSMDKQRIIGSDRLYNSFKKALFYTGGNMDKASVSFSKYGRMVDMGVGKGMPIGARRDLGDSVFLKKRERSGRLKSMARKPKLWYSRVKTSETMRLREILFKEYRIGLIHEVEKGLTDNIKINL
ncbi:MAG: hypothetical protein WBP45_15745 [Daejeonella sp.]